MVPKSFPFSIPNLHMSSACGEDEREGDLKGDMWGADTRLGVDVGGMLLSTGLGRSTGLSRPNVEVDVGD